MGFDYEDVVEGQLDQGFSWRCHSAGIDLTNPELKGYFIIAHNGDDFYAVAAGELAMRTEDGFRPSAILKPIAPDSWIFQWDLPFGTMKFATEEEASDYARQLFVDSDYDIADWYTMPFIYAITS